MRNITRFAAAVLLVAAGLTSMSLASHAGEVAYVPLGGENKLVLIDTSTDKVVGTIEGVPAVHGLAMTPDRGVLIAGSYEARERADKAPARPSGVSADEHAAHHTPSAASPGAKSPQISTLSIIRAADRSVARRLDVPGAVHHVAVSPEGRFAVVTHPAEDSISAIDLASFVVVANLATGPLPNYAAFSPDGKSVYVSNAGNGTVSAVEVGRWIVRWNAVVGTAPEHVVLSRDGATLYVNDAETGAVSALDTATRTLAKTIPVGEIPHGIGLSDDGRTLFVTARGDAKLVAVDLGTGQTRSLALTPEPYHLFVIPGADKLYVTSAEAPKIWVVDIKALKVTSEIPIGGTGHQIAVAPGG